MSPWFFLKKYANFAVRKLAGPCFFPPFKILFMGGAGEQRDVVHPMAREKLDKMVDDRLFSHRNKRLRDLVGYRAQPRSFASHQNNGFRHP